MKTSLALAACGIALAGCAANTRGPGSPDPREASVASAAGWRVVATPFDRERIRGWRGAWTEALRLARDAGHDADIAREGALLLPDAALPGAALPEGAYDCRVVKVGGQRDLLDFIAYPRFDCRIDSEGGRQHFVKLGGSQRPVGHLYPDTDRRHIFLGTLILGDERMAMRYGQDRDRDLAGLVERIGPRRWRLVLPRPRFESIVDVVELVPRSPAWASEDSTGTPP